MMNFRTIILILTAPLLFISCTKKDFSENHIIYGQWIEETSLMDQEELYFTENDTLYYGTRSASRYISLEKYIYSLNNSHTKLYLWSVDDSDGQRNTCKIDLKNNRTELTISGLQEDNPDHEQKFTRVGK